MTSRRTLPNRRYAETVELSDGKNQFKVTVGFYNENEKGTVAEVFFSGAKAGSDLESTARDGAVLISIALQHGVAVEVMRQAVLREADGKASSIIGKVLDVLER